MKGIAAIAMSALTALLADAGMAFAAQLRVDPITVELSAPAAAGALTLHNGESTEVAVQARVFRWLQVNGQESLVETSDVVASPPTVRMAPHSDYVVRVVRVSKQPVAGEESYRVIIDQLPDIRKRQSGTVEVLIRQSIPIFFRAQQLNPARVAWSLQREGNKLIVTAANQGDERLRIASLRLRDAAGAIVSFGNGLVGYALGRSSMSWEAPSPPRGFGAGGPVVITAETNKGPDRATAEVGDRR